MRDYYVLCSPKDLNEADKTKIAALITAVAEYDKFNGCINNYYKPNGEVLEALSDLSTDEIKAKYNQEKAQHWTNFWQLVMLNVEDWRVNA